MAAKVKFGVISCAKIAQTKHIPALKNVANAEVAAISSRSAHKAQDVAARFGIPKSYGSYEELISDPGIDAVVNPLPNTMHHEWTIRAVNAGKHVMCEKPIAMTVQEAREMFAAAEENCVRLAEAWTHRLTGQMRFVREQVAQGKLGRITEANGRMGSFVVDVDTNIRASATLGGGSLWDRGSYPVSALRFVLGAEPETVFAARRDYLERDIDSTIVGILGFPGNVLATVASSLEQPRTNRFSVLGSHGAITMLNMFEEDASVLLESDAGVEEVPFSGPDRFVTLYEDFCNAILDRARQEFGRQDAIANTAALTALLKSAATGQPVSVAEMLLR